MREMGPVGQQPIGFLDLLRLKNMGDNPDGLSSMYQPTLELVPWLLERDREIVTGVGSVAAGAGGVAFTLAGGTLGTGVPANEVWFIHSMNASIAMQATGFFKGTQALVINHSPTGTAFTYHAVKQSDFTAGASGGFQLLGEQVRRFVKSNCSFGMAWSDIFVPVGPGFTIAYTFEVTRLRA